jgi:DNA-binding MarR family transcriptional regulator
MASPVTAKTAPSTSPRPRSPARRGKLIRLTAAGVAATDRLIAVHLENQRRLVSGLPADERDQLADLLGRLCALLEE